MRAWLVLLFLPLAGCLGGGPVAAVGPFVFEAIERGDPSPVPVDSCADLLDLLNDRAYTESKVRLHQSIEGHGGYWPVMMELAVDDMAMAESASDGAMGAPATRAADADVTGTNNQEAGADEADLLKTDGEWTYVLQSGYLIILHSDHVGDLEEVSRTRVDDVWGGQLLLERDRLVVITHGSSAKEVADSAMGLISQANALTRIQVFDVSDRSAPESIHELFVEGNNVGARLIDGVAYVVVHQWEPYLELVDYADPWPSLEAEGKDWRDWEAMPEASRKAYLRDIAEEALEHNAKIIDGLSLRDHVPLVLVPRGDSMVPAPITEAACHRFLATPDDTGRSISTILALDVGGLDHETTQIISGHPIVYGAPGALVLAAASQNDWWYWAQPKLDEATNLHWFDLKGLDVQHRASGRVDGIVQDQFGIDVHDDELRVATTTGTWGRWWLEDPDPMMNHLVVFAERAGILVEQGRIGGIAPEERLWSARFTDDRAYLVTFEQIDPLWVIDLQDPAKPTILGELEIPGVSTYIHPLSEDALLTIGIGPSEGGRGLDWSRLQVSLFDISDPSDPKRADVLELSPGSKGWSYSAAVDEHKAFAYWDKLGKLAVPLSTHYYGEVWDADANGEGKGEWVYKEEHHIGLKLIDVDEAAMQLRLYGEVDQDHLLQDGQGRPCGGLEIQRSYFLGFPDAWPAKPVSVYASSSLGMSAHDLETLEPQGAVNFGIDGCDYRFEEVRF